MLLFPDALCTLSMKLLQKKEESIKILAILALEYFEVSRRREFALAITLRLFLSRSLFLARISSFHSARCMLRVPCHARWTDKCSTPFTIFQIWKPLGCFVCIQENSWMKNSHRSIPGISESTKFQIIVTRENEILIL